jgi:hypothetical protein
MHELFAKYLDNLASPAEVRQLLALFNFPENEAELRKLILQCLEHIDYDDDMNLCKSVTEKKLPSIKKQIKASNGKVVSLLKSFRFRSAMANCITLHLSLQV